MDLMEQRKILDRDGVLFLPKALDAEWLMLLEMGIQRVLGDAGQAKFRFYEGEDREFIETVRNFDVTPEIQRLLYDSPIADIMADLIDSQDIWLYSDEMFIKQSGHSGRTPWHQDLPYFPMAGEKMASMWISLDPLPKSDCLELVPGSHRQVMYDGFDPQAVSQDPKKPYYGEDLPPLPDIEAERDKWQIVSWDIEPGDVIVFHPGVLHGGGSTSGGRVRRAITVRLYGDDVVYDARPPSRPTAPILPGLGMKLKPGDPLRHPYFPRLRPLPDHQQAI